MKKIIYLLAVFTLVSATVKTGKSYIKEVTKARKQKDKKYKKGDHSPIKGEAKNSFTGLRYYDINEAYRVKAKFTALNDSPTFKMSTSSGKDKIYTTTGQLDFVLNDTARTLFTYHNVQNGKVAKDYLFIPFNDYTNGGETYGAGRFIDIDYPSTDSVYLDFNMAYNPSCAYSDGWSCPIPPDANKLPTYIYAGEKVLYTEDVH